ncbi:MAG: hypothetical protein AMXMBFR67_22600 [Nitrospira sp.]
MNRQDLFVNLRTALQTREEMTLLQPSADMAMQRFQAHAESDLIRLIRLLGNLLRKSGIPAETVEELNGFPPLIALALDDARSRGVFISPHDGSSLTVTLRGGEASAGEETRIVEYRYCTVRGLEQILEEAMRSLILVPPI